MKNMKSGGGQTSNNPQTVQMDLSILRPAIAASVSGFLDVIKAFKNGSTEVNFIQTQTFYLSNQTFI